MRFVRYMIGLLQLELPKTEIISDGMPAEAPAPLNANTTVAPPQRVDLARIKGYKKYKKPYVPREAVYRGPNTAISLQLPRIQLRRTFGNGLGSGQILTKAPNFPKLIRDRGDAGNLLEKLEPGDEFMVLATYLPTIPEISAEGLAYNQSEWLPYNKGYFDEEWHRMIVLEVMVQMHQDKLVPFVRAFSSNGTEIARKKWFPMTVENVRLLFDNEDALSALADFSGLQYKLWKPEIAEPPLQSLVSDEVASVLAQKRYLE